MLKMMMLLNKEKGEESFSFFEHLADLRARFIKCLLLFCFAAICTYGSFDRVYEILSASVGNLVFLSPQDALMARLIVSWSCALLLISPYVAYHFWSFSKSGLKEAERRSVKVFAPISFLLLIGGGSFAYFIMMPVLMRFLLSFQTVNMVAMITVSNYFRFLFVLVFSFSILFQLPLFLLFLTRVGWVTPQQLTQKRRHAFVLMLIAAALLTPPDIITQFMVAAPLIVLFEIGVLFSKGIYHRRKRDE